jgi:hypothetical protein
VQRRPQRRRRRRQRRRPADLLLVCLCARTWCTCACTCTCTDGAGGDGDGPKKQLSVAEEMLARRRGLNGDDDECVRRQLDPFTHLLCSKGPVGAPAALRSRCDVDMSFMLLTSCGRSVILSCCSGVALLWFPLLSFWWWWWFVGVMVLVVLSWSALILCPGSAKGRRRSGA